MKKRVKSNIICGGRHVRLYGIAARLRGRNDELFLEVVQVVSNRRSCLQ